MNNTLSDENYIVIQGWMVNKLNLKGNELLVYAIIYGFSQAEQQTFSGSLQYLANWTNSTKQGVIKALKSLEEKNFIIKKEEYRNSVKFCEYYSTKFNGGIQQSLTGGIKQSLPNNITIDNLYDNLSKTNEIGSLKVKKNSKLSKIEQIQEMFNKCTKNEQTRALLNEWLNLRKTKPQLLTPSSIKLNLRKLKKLADESNMGINEYLEEIICRGWLAFYPIFKNKSKQFNDSDRHISPEDLLKSTSPADDILKRIDEKNNTNNH